MISDTLLLDRLIPVLPRIDGEAELWQWQGVLNVIDGAGQRVPVPDNVRLYQNSGFSHINIAGLLSPPQSPGICQNLRHKQRQG